MKKSLLFGWAAAAAVVLFGACNQVPQPTTETETGTLIVKPVLIGEGIATRTAGTDVVGKEATVTSAQLLIFDTSGHLEYYTTLAGGVTSVPVQLRVGSMKAWVVANGPDLSNVKTESALTATVLELSTYNDPSTDFVMAGSNTCTVTASNTADCVVEISRLVARVTLKSLTSNLPSAYGAVTVNYVMLENVVSQCRIDGQASGLNWYNPMGRATESPLVAAHIVNPPTYAADAPSLTYQTLGSSSSFNKGTSYTTPLRFYAYPNNTATDQTGFATTFTARYTRLVIKATIDGGTYYYPISIPALARNKCYDVSVTLVGLGSTDPDVPVVKGAFDASFTVKAWVAGSEITESI